MRRRHAYLLALSLAFGLAADVVAQNAQAGRYFEDALRRYEAKDLDGAIVQLKNALQQDRQFLSAQLLLGKASLENSNPAAAEVALSEVLRLGASRNEVAPLLARALVGQGQHQRMLEDPRLLVEGLSVTAQVDLLLIQATARADMGNDREAMAAIDQARRLQPNNAAVWLAEIPLRIRSQAFDQAKAAVERARALEPNLADVHYNQAAIAHSSGRLDEALAAYAATLSRNPNHLEALVGRAGIALDRGNVDGAIADLQAIRKLHPRDPRADYMSALAAERKGDSKAARDALLRVTQILDPAPVEYLRYRPQFLMLGGLSHYGLRQPERAIPYLDALVKVQPRSTANKLLAQVLMDMGQVENSIVLLENYIQGQPADIQAIALLAGAHSQQGRHSKATQLMSQALRSHDTAELRGVLGLSLLRSGKVEDAQRELEMAWKRDPGRIATGTALATLYLQNRQPDKAAILAGNLASRHPKVASLQHLLGMSLAAKGDAKGARKAYSAALALNNNLFEARAGLARLDLLAGRGDDALRELERVHRGNEQALEPMLELALINRRLGKLEDAARWLERAVTRAGPKETRPNFAQVDLLLTMGRPAEALTAAKTLVAKTPENPLALIALAQAQLANGQPAAARPNLVQASRRIGFDADNLAGIGRLQAQAGDLPGAVYTLSKALEINPQHAEALLQLSSAEIQQGELTAAEKNLTQLLRVNPGDARSHLLAAELAEAQGRHAQVTQALRRAHELQPSTATTMRLVLHLDVTDRGNAALNAAEAWLRKRPDDGVVRRALAEMQTARGLLAGARKNYEWLVRRSPSDARALNNLAQILNRQGDRKQAIQMAERAVKAAPQAAPALDTYAWLLHLEGQHDKALSLLRDARLRAPDNAEIRYHLAAVLAKMGRRAEARSELQQALKAPTGLESADEAQALLRTLN